MSRTASFRVPGRLRRGVLPTLAAGTLAAGLLVAPAALTVTTAEAATVGLYSATVSPTSVPAGAPSAYAVRFANVSLLPVNSARIAVPVGFTVTGLGTARTGGDTWGLTQGTCTTVVAPCSSVGQKYLEADALGGPSSGPIWPLGSLVVTFQADAAAAPGTYTWGTGVTTWPNWAGLSLALYGSAPTTTVTPSTPTELVVSGLPGTVTAGSPLSLTVTATDAYGNAVAGYRGTVHFALSSTTSTGSTVPADYSFTAGDAGRHTFGGLTMTGAPSQSLTVSDPAAPSIGTTTTVSVSPAGASRLALTAPATATAGSSFVSTVTAYDAYGNVATGYTGTVHLGVDTTGTGTSLPADHTFTAADAGSFSAPTTLTVAGARTLTASDGTRSDSASVQVAPAGSASLRLTGPSGSVQAGQAASVTVKAVDAFGNAVSGFTGTVSFSSAQSGLTLPSPYTFTAADAGQHTFSVTGTVATDVTLTVTGSSPALPPSSTAWTVTPAAAATGITAAPASLTSTAGDPFSVTFSVRDTYGNLVTTDARAVSFTCTGTGADGSCPAAGSFAGGQVTVVPVLTVAGSGGVTASATGLASGSTAVTVAAGPAAGLVVTGPDKAVGAGEPFDVSVAVVDAYGNPVSASPSVTLTSGPVVAPFPVTATASGGVASFGGLSVTTAGGYGLTASATGLASGTSGLTVVPGPATKVVYTTPPPATVTAGSTFSVTAGVADQYGNVVLDDSASVVTLGSTPAGVSGSATVSAGTATFSGLSLTTAGPYTVTAGSAGLAKVDAAVTVVGGAPASLVFDGVADEGTDPPLPHPVVNKPFDTSVRFVDAYGNPATAPAGTTVTLSKVTGTGALGGTVSAPVTTGAGGATIAGSTYTVLENNVTFRVAMTGASPTPTPASFTVDLAGQAATFDATPGIAAPTLASLDPVTGAPCVLGPAQTTCSKFVLPKGALDAVYLYQTKCDAGCQSNGGTTAQIVYATADLTDAAGRPLYDATHPAALVVDCYVTLCPKPKDSPQKGGTYSVHNLQADATVNALEVTVFLPGSKTQTVTGIAGVCAKAGVVDAGMFFCLDPTKSTRDAAGYHPYLLFYGDPKGRIT